MNAFAFAAVLGAAAVRAQQIGTITAEVHPSLTWQTCTSSGCTNVAGSVVLDANWRWLHSTSGSTNCYTGNTWDATLCPDPTTCAANCALDGASYASTYGVSTSGNALTLKFVTKNSSGTNVGSRLYLLADNTHYEMFNLKNREFTFDVDVSQLGCGLNGALYFSEMAADGGMSAYPTNKAGAQYGTGYCDSQCPHDLKFINGAANVDDWTGTSTNSGTGNVGSCCNEMDIWEANEYAAAVTPHPCQGVGLTACTGTTCTTTCDQAGCDFNAYRFGNLTYYGPGSSYTLDTTKPMTVVTQFVTDDGTDTGTLAAIYRVYSQGGNVFQNAQSLLAGATGNVITDDWCAAQKTATATTNTFGQEGGLTTMGESFARGVVLVLSIWDDTAVSMLWLDSVYPTDQPASNPGVTRGPCAVTSGVPATIETTQASDQVIYSNIKFGTLGSTTAGVAAPPKWGGGTTGPTSTSGPTSSKPVQSTTTTTVSKPPSSTKTTTTTTTTHTTTTTTHSAPASTQTKYGQCGGNGWTGATVCASGSTCKAVSPPYYSQCL